MKLYCTNCKKVTTFKPHPVDIARGAANTVVCIECNRNRVHLKEKSNEK